MANKLCPNFTIWFTGFSASGKSTLANNLQKSLLKKGVESVVLDGDEIRRTVNSDLKFTIPDREENNRRVAEIARIINNCGIISICALISPTNKIRDEIRSIIGDEKFLLIYVDTPIKECEKRDNKFLYQKARAGEIKNFTGLTSIYEIPFNADIIVDGLKPIDENIEELLTKLNSYLP
ncbi:adenylyl-sulfate kinase [Bacteroidota bacterium]